MSSLHWCHLREGSQLHSLLFTQKHSKLALNAENDLVCVCVKSEEWQADVCIKKFVLQLPSVIVGCTDCSDMGGPLLSLARHQCVCVCVCVCVCIL